MSLVSPVRRAMREDAPLIAQRVAEQLSGDHRLQPLVSEEFSRQDFELALAGSTAPVWVADIDGRVAGHLYGATLPDPVQGRQTWTGPDGYSYESAGVLEQLCECAYGFWRDEGSRAHLVWALAGSGAQAWTERSYAPVSVRGARQLAAASAVSWPSGHVLRRAAASDLETIVTFDQLIDLAQGTRVDEQTLDQREADRADLLEMIEDPECRFYLLDVEGVPAGQCVTFALPTLRGNYEHTLYLGSLAIDPALRRRRLATRLLHAVLDDALEQGYRYAEARWHVDNGPATALWSAMGFRPTYVQLRRSMD